MGPLRQGQQIVNKQLFIVEDVSLFVRLKRGAGLARATAVAFSIGLWIGKKWVPRNETRIIPNDSDRTSTAITTQSRTQRNVAVVKAGARITSSTARTKAQQVFASAEHKIELQNALELQTAEEVAQTLGNMKGAMMKIGQMASYLDDGLPAPMRQALASLQANAPPMSGELAARAFEAELGGRPEKLFAQWDATPIASASIGQVHRAISHNGQALAVKIQYPGVAQAIESDLNNADMITRLMSMIYPSLDSKPFINELRSRINEELDYNLEAKNQRLFADYYQGHPLIRIPKVVDEYSTARVLTTELSDGVRFSEAETWSQEARNNAAEVIFRFAFRSLYRLRAFNGDPHPGNYLFHKDGAVTFLDFGLVRHFIADDEAIFEAMIKAMLINRDPKAWRKAIVDASLLDANAPFNDQEVYDWFSHYYQYLLVDEPVALTPEYATETVRYTFNLSEQPMLKYTNVPPNFVLLQRINVGLTGVLGKLHPTLNFRAISEELWPFTNRAATTPIGKAEAVWLDAKSVG